jgi:hypothetical protein
MQEEVVFDYPFLYMAVPYHVPPISASRYMQEVIPAARAVRQVDVPVPVAHASNPTNGASDDVMDMDPAYDESRTISVGTDGVLLYVLEASYQPVREYIIFHTTRHS